MQPPACPKCGAQPVFRKTCVRCTESIWAIQHSSHYMGGAIEVIPCRCTVTKTPEHNRIGYEKKRNDTVEKTGKVFETEKYKHITTPEMAKKAAQGLANGLSMSKALKEAGYTKGASSHGRHGLNKMIRIEMKRLGGEYMQLAKDITPEEQELLVRGMLVENVILKTDKGVMAAKQLGADKRVAMWQPDSQVGMVILSPPPMPKLDHEVKWIETKHNRKEDSIMMKTIEPETGPKPEEPQDDEPPEPDAAVSRS